MKTYIVALSIFIVCFSTSYTQTPPTGSLYDGNGGPLSLAQSPYLVTGDVTIPTGQTLTIEAGVVIRFNQYRGWEINGKLLAEGTETNHIQFTTNVTGEYWRYLCFLSGSKGKLNYCDLEYGGIFDDAQLLLQYPDSLFIDHSTFNHSNANGFKGSVDDTGYIEITHSQFSNNANDGVWIYTTGNTTIADNEFTANGGNGIEAYSGDSTIILSNNGFTNNTAAAYRLGTNLYPTGGSFLGNGFDGIELVNGEASRSGTYAHNLRVTGTFTINNTESTLKTPNNFVS